MTPSIPDTNAWHGKRVLVTGHTGFKGSWLSLWLDSLGAEVSGLSDQVQPAPALFAQADLEQIVDHNIADVRDAEAVHAILERVDPKSSSTSPPSPSFADPSASRSRLTKQT